ncbi:transcriptional regulator [Natronorubrum halalkaliphilum]|uniref:transcriptional regulator n=1 Tax=Natronorubrum halalkaliphilum TaxID=2691917 RepID=UPI002E2B5298|nr:transcriptional regulator [Natronorubrum halalkaliphilum]
MADNVFEALSDRYRRQLLLELLDRNPGEVLSQSKADSGYAIPSISQHHVHLPKLEAYGFIEWNRDQQIVTKGPQFDEIEPMLELFRENADAVPGDWT